MKFYIDSSKLFIRNEANGDFTLMSLESNQTVDFTSYYQPLLRTFDRWVDFSSFTRAMLMMSFGRTDTIVRFRDALYSLHAAGIAQLKNVSFDSKPGIRWAKLEDYILLANFCSANYNKGFSCCVAGNISYYSYNGIYNRLKQGTEKIIIKLEDQKIQAVMICGPSTRFFGGPIYELKSFAFSADLDEPACRAAASEMINFLTSQYHKKLRYEWLVPRQEFIVSILKDAGFRETAYLKNELKSGLDLRLLDYVADII